MTLDRKEEIYDKLSRKVTELFLDVIRVKDTTDTVAFFANVTETELYFILEEIAATERTLRLVKTKVNIIYDSVFPAAVSQGEDNDRF